MSVIVNTSVVCLRKVLSFPFSTIAHTGSTAYNTTRYSSMILPRLQNHSPVTPSTAAAISDVFSSEGTQKCSAPFSVSNAQTPIILSVCATLTAIFVFSSVVFLAGTVHVNILICIVTSLPVASLVLVRAPLAFDCFESPHPPIIRRFFFSRFAGFRKLFFPSQQRHLGRSLLPSQLLYLGPSSMNLFYLLA